MVTDMKETVSFNFVRLVLASLVLFELANWIGLLHVQLQFTWLGLVVTSALVWLALEVVRYFLHTTGSARMPAASGMGAAAVVSFDALGDMLHWYGAFSWYDQAMHFLGGASAAAVIYMVLQRWAALKQWRVGRGWISFIALAITSLAGTAYELEEYFEDYLHGAYQQRLGDGVDTANDLLFNLIGAGVILMIFLVSKRQKSSFSQTLL